MSAVSSVVREDIQGRKLRTGRWYQFTIDILNRRGLKDKDFKLLQSVYHEGRYFLAATRYDFKMKGVAEDISRCFLLDDEGKKWDYRTDRPWGLTRQISWTLLNEDTKIVKVEKAEVIEKLGEEKVRKIYEKAGKLWETEKKKHEAENESMKVSLGGHRITGGGMKFRGSKPVFSEDEERKKEEKGSSRMPPEKEPLLSEKKE